MTYCLPKAPPPNSSPLGGMVQHMTSSWLTQAFSLWIAGVLDAGNVRCTNPLGISTKGMTRRSEVSGPRRSWSTLLMMNKTLEPSKCPLCKGLIIFTVLLSERFCYERWLVHDWQIEVWWQWKEHVALVLGAEGKLVVRSSFQPPSASQRQGREHSAMLPHHQQGARATCVRSRFQRRLRAP